MATSSERATRAAPFALRVVNRLQGLAAIVYRRRVNDRMQERFDRVAALSPLALTAGSGLLRSAVKAAGGPARLQAGPFQPLDADWGARRGLRPGRTGFARRSAIIQIGRTFPNRRSVGYRGPVL